MVVNLKMKRNEKDLYAGKNTFVTFQIYGRD